MTAVDLRPAHRTPATMTDYQRLMAAALAEQTVACPKCNAPVGEFCRSAGGYQNSAVGFHAARKKLIADLDEDDRVAASAAMKDAEDRRRAATDAHMARLEADPQYVAGRDASRKWWNEQFGRIDAEVRDLPVEPVHVAAEVRRGVPPVTDLTAVRAVRRSTRKPVA